MNDKKTFIKSFFPESVNDIQIVHMNLDQVGLTICDILRNINKFFPANSHDRFEMIDGHKVVAVICRSDLIEPINGIILLISHNVEIKTSSKNYILLTVDEADLTTEEHLNDVNELIIDYLCTMMKNTTINFADFYVKYLYNDYEDKRFESDEEDDE